jgi:hypothetical protein
MWTTEDQTVAAGHSVEVDPARWQEGFDELLGRVAGRFARVELRRRTRAFVGGRLSDLPRKNCWTVAEHAGDPSLMSCSGPSGPQWPCIAERLFGDAGFVVRVNEATDPPVCEGWSSQPILPAPLVLRR